MINIILVLFLFISIFTFTEILAIKYKINIDITRKISHILSGIIIYFTPIFFTKLEILIISSLFIIILSLTKYFSLLKSVHSVSRNTLGEVFFPLGVFVSALFFLPNNINAFQFGILIMTFSDAIASFVGISMGRHKIYILKNKKSIEGSLAFFISSVLICFFFYKNIDYKILLIPLILTPTELLLIFGIDNLVLPILAAYLFTIFS